MNTTNNDPQAARRPGRPLAAEIDESLVPIIETVLQRHRAVTLDAMTDILQDGDSLINDDWDQVDEDEIEAKWQRSERKKSSNHVGTRKKNDDPLRDLWRVCVRFFKQTPPVLLSPYNRLQFVPKIEKDSAALSCHLFTKGACNAIADLILHTVWQQDHRPFIHTLIYAANCRSFKGKELPKTVHQLHIYARNAAIEEREEPSIFSDLMYGIGESATVEKSPSMRELDLLRHNIIPFRITDVECIQKTIDAFAYSDERVSYSVKSVADAFKLLKRDEVPTRYQLRELDARACKQMLRIIARPGLHGREQPASRSGPSTRDTERVASRSRSPRQSPDISQALIRSRHRSHSDRDSPPTSPQRSVRPCRGQATSSAQVARYSTSFPSTEISHRRSQRHRSPLGEQFASAGPGSIQHERDRAPPHMGAQDRFIEELKSSVESQKTEIQNLSKRLTETDRKVEGHESRIRSLQEENRVLKQQLTRYVTGTQSDSP
ncbi:hypothetical protein FOPG_10025 [Fusarium oxysporum f. sp. conglutinans race 2 54008]|uniref:Uncharacterized protein n=1 Tax=Fusarium oxysporum f. sp. conglutinans race 2 54008 TaxID=1089457 RepID=X0HEX7_FUSOX|nr:hypothetical protein FOPG_10025 [Fusarium oxysporum f. sp. conglutinans race 2 54008]KAJ4045444.1 hypothetical protein NW763_010557 [Fusarium oxysporum]KAJ4046544.1 hypothetical protein NW753_009365 [Fusarium oxysporum]KAJ4075266.1 hypothetical protein NW756_013487 [Fusarium oxysporum]KAJ4096023.1 hypothetical protein NW769_011628 [Fusarium oxysporum]